jgi:hypothetical protein
VIDDAAALALLTAVAELNPHGRGSVSGREAADVAGLTLGDRDLDELVRHLMLANPPRLYGRAPRAPGEQWVLLRIP